MSGYSEGGASLNKKTLKTWLPNHLSAKSDIDRNLNTLRNRAHDLSINSALGAAAINTMVTGVIGSGLKLFPRINAADLGLTPEQARLWRRKVKQEFNFWCENADFLRRNNFYEQQIIAFQSMLVDGDCFCLFKRRAPARNNPYSLRLQLVEAQRVSNPFGGAGGVVEMLAPNGNRIVNGIEVSPAGELVAIHVSNRLFNEFDLVNAQVTWQRVKIYGEESGLPNVLMICKDSRPDQFRGVPILAPVVEALKQVSRYADAELTSSIIKSFFSVFFIQPASNFNMNEITGKANEPDEVDVTEYKLGSGTISALPKGVDVKAIDSAKNQSTFDSFTTHFIKQIGASIGLPYEVLLKNFQSSYSASRAALLQAQETFRQRREAFVVDFLQPIYEQFLMESIALGRIDAPGFFSDPIKKHLWSRADWYSQRNQILDPVKEANAAKTRLELGLTTYSQEIAEMNGGDFEDVVETLRQERELIMGIEHQSEREELAIKKFPAQ